MNITLIGMSGAGKSHIGRLLADRLGYRLLDVDRDLWEVKYRKPIQAILDERGEEWYLGEEERLILESTKGKDALVISPPGSVAYLPNALQHLKDISKIVYLRVPFEVIEERNGRIAPHAVIGLGRKSLRELYEERAPIYEKHADMVIDTHERHGEDIIDSIVDFLHNRK